MKKNQKGFTLAELLIVVAIIAVLIAIGIPIFASQLEKSRESTDLSDVRSAYSEIMTAVITEDTTVSFYSSSDGKWSVIVPLRQKKNGWQMDTPLNIGGVLSGSDGGSNAEHTWIGTPAANGTCTVSYDHQNGIIFLWSGSSDGSPDSGGDMPSGGNPDTPDSGDDTPPVSGDGNNNTPPDAVVSNAVPYPQNFTEDTHMLKGTIYSDNGKYYILTSDQNANQYYRPDLHSDIFQEIPASRNILTYSDIDSGQPVRNGDLFLAADGHYYVRAYSNNDYWKDPEGEPRNWIMIR